jgi:general secretion pathway protein L
LGGLVSWWAQRMAELLPARLRATTGEFRDALLVDAPQPAQGFALAVRARRRISALGSFRIDDGAAARAVVARQRRMADVVLRLPAALLLEREVTLPAAAEQDLESVIGYEMDRVTPFTAAEVFWSAAVLRRDRARGQIGVRLSLVARQTLAPLLAALAEAGIAPTAIEAGGAPSPRVIVVRKRAPRGRRARRVLNVLVAVLAVAALVVPFVRTELAIRATDAQIDALRPAVQQAEALRRSLAADTTSADAIATEQARLGDALAALAAVTEILPDDTFLTELGLRQRRLTMAGQSAAAARLIGLLSDDPLIRNPAFTAPVTRTETGHADLFVLRAELGP